MDELRQANLKLARLRQRHPSLIFGIFSFMENSYQKNDLKANLKAFGQGLNTMQTDIITMAGWMTCDFTSFSTVFHSYQDDGRMIMIGLCNGIPFTIEKISP